MQKYAMVDESGLIYMISSSDVSRNGWVAVLCGDEVSDDTHYYNAKTLSFLEKTELDTAYVARGLSVVFWKIPPGVFLYCNGSSVVSDEDGVEIEFDSPGIYQIFFMKNQFYKDVSLEVTVG